MTLEKEAQSALASLREAGPGAICEECGHLAARHHGNINGPACLFPRGVRAPACDCGGMVWLGYRFVMRNQTGPSYVKEKV